MKGRFVKDAEGKKYICEHCQTHLACSDDIIKFFYYKLGKPYLFDNVVNVTVGEKEERSTSSGTVTTANIFCVGCRTNVGFKYEAAEKSLKFKVGKFFLERYIELGPDGSNCSMTRGIRHLQL